jgi:phosphatidylglycerophosphatase A
MMQLSKWISSLLGVGFVKGGGTVAALITCVLWWFFQQDGRSDGMMAVLAILITIIGTISATVVEKDWGKDSSRVVIDEVAGMCIGLLFVPVTIPWVITGLVLFRFFDIVKPLYIRKMEALPGGWGVMADDVLAGIYTNMVIQILLYLNLWPHS